MPKLFPKIFITLFLLIFTIQLLSLIVLLALPTISQAGDLKFTPQVAIPDYTFNPSDKTTGNIANYIRAIYKYAIGIVGILAAVVLMFGGIIWLTAGGNTTQIGNAKAWIGASLTGLVLALLSYTILATVNPALVNFKVSEIKPIEPSALPVTFDPTIPCGEFSGNKLICGSKCDGNKKCEKVAKGTTGARECPPTLTASEQGKGDYWLCSTLSGGGENCCYNNNDSDCPSGLICNMGLMSGQCTSASTCTAKQGEGGACAEIQDCLDNYICNNQRCRSINPGYHEQCNNGNCASPFICAGKQLGGDPGICTNGANGEPCRSDSECPNSTQKKCTGSWLTPGNCY